jgi:hypothetical protein
VLTEFSIANNLLINYNKKMAEFKTVLDKKTGELKRLSLNASIEPEQLGVDAATLSKLDDLSKAELIALIKRVSGACWGVGLMSKEETAEAMLLRLAVDGLTTDDARQALANINAWLDRERGKPAQSVTQTNTLNVNLIASELRQQSMVAINDAIARLSTTVIDNQ